MQFLAATWEQLQAKGYQALTIEGVAQAAATTKTVLYRRWPDKAHLVLAALSKYDNFTGYMVPDTVRCERTFWISWGKLRLSRN